MSDDELDPDTGSAATNVRPLPTPGRHSLEGRLPEPSRFTIGRTKTPRRTTPAKVAVLIAVIVLVVVIARSARSHDTGVQLSDVKAGNCIKPPGNSATTVSVVDCSQPHSVEVYAVGVADEVVVTDAARDPEIFRICDSDLSQSLAQTIENNLQSGAAEFSYLIGASRTGPVACLITTPSRTGSFVAGTTS